MLRGRAEPTEEDGRDFEVPRESDGSCGGDVMTFVVGCGSAVDGSEFAEELVGGGVTEAADFLEGDGLAVGVVDDRADVVVHALAVTEVEGVVVGTADGFLNTEAAENGNSPRLERRLRRGGCRR